MNTSVQATVGITRYGNFPTALYTGSILHDMIDFLFRFLLATIISYLLRSKHAFYHGSICSWISTRCPALMSTVVLGATVLISKGLSYLYSHQGTRGSHNHSKQEPTRQKGHKEQPKTEDISTDLRYFKPLLFPSRTTHRRLYPTPHAFNYSYLLVGIPVLETPIPTNPMLSTHPSPPHPDFNSHPHNLHPQPKPAWFSVHASDHLHRTQQSPPLPPSNNPALRTKLNHYLTTQNIHSPSTTYPTAYLITAPRVLTFTFNPVSFWYLYDASHALSAMILEVNNTFDERRMYFLSRGEDNTGQNRNGSSSHPDDEEPDKSDGTPSVRFTSTWNKDFHVSPFNDRDGTYSVSATDILRTGRVDVTIVLRDPPSPSPSTPSSPTNSSTPPNTHATPKLIARIFTPSHQPIDPTTLSPPQRTLFLLTHGPTGFLTNPRILLQARRLWSMGLTVFYRPEPRSGTVPRVMSPEEGVVQGVVGEVLRRVRVGLQGVIEDGEEDGNESENENADKGQQGKNGAGAGAGGDSVIHVLTPAFYSELVRGRGSLWECLDRLCFDVPDREKTVYCSSAVKLRRVLEGGGALSNASISGSSDDGSRGSPRRSRFQPTYTDILQAVISRLRLPTRKAFASLFQSDCDLVCPTLDQHVRYVSSTEQYMSYLHASLGILLADKVALGNTALLRFEVRVVRVILVLVMTMGVMGVVDRILYGSDVSGLTAGEIWGRRGG